MHARRAIQVVEDSRFRQHRGPAGHPERPERLDAVADALAAFGDVLVHLEPRQAEPGEIAAVHDLAHLRALERLAGRSAQLDPDTYFSPPSWEVAQLAAGSVIELARRVTRGEARAGFAAVRPPGHHAEAGHAMGFCLLNNVAIAARALQRQEGLDRVLILDWDVHHGNGTQHSFEADPSVLYFSTHQFPYYPGTGDFCEAGVGAGEGTTLNVPMPAGCGDSEYVGVFQRILVPAARWFRPDAILVSCGFDAHMRDPLAAMALSGAGFARMSQIVVALAEELCGGRLLLTLEGGYDLEGLREGVGAVISTLLGPPDSSAPREEIVEMPAGSTLRGLVDRVAAVHRQRVRDLGSA